MTDKTRWLGLGPWHEDNESELIDWTAQPQYKGLVKPQGRAGRGV